MHWKLIGSFIVVFLIGFVIVFGYSYKNQQQLSYSNMPLTTKFSLDKAPSESLQGEVASISGKVNWLSRIAVKPVSIKSSRRIQQGEELSTSNNGHAIVRIQKDALITLSPNSHINFIQLLPINFVFAQDKGSISYQSDGQAVSVISHGLDTAISRGWAIIVVDPVDDTVTISVTRGFVTVGYEDEQNNSNVVTVNAGQQFNFDYTTKTGSIP